MLFGNGVSQHVIWQGVSQRVIWQQCDIACYSWTLFMTLVFIGKPHFKNWFYFHLPMHRILFGSYTDLILCCGTEYLYLVAYQNGNCSTVPTWRLQYNPFLKFYTHV